MIPRFGHNLPYMPDVADRNSRLEGPDFHQTKALRNRFSVFSCCATSGRVRCTLSLIVDIFVTNLHGGRLYYFAVKESLREGKRRKWPARLNYVTNSRRNSSAQT